MITNVKIPLEHEHDQSFIDEYETVLESYKASITHIYDSSDFFLPIFLSSPKLINSLIHMHTLPFENRLNVLKK